MVFMNGIFIHLACRCITKYDQANQLMEVDEFILGGGMGGLPGIQEAHQHPN